MAEEKTTRTPRTITMKASLIYFAISLVLNSFGNVVTLVTSKKVHPQFLGSAVWTACENNLGLALHWSLFITFLLLGVAVTILDAILLGHLYWKRAIGNILFMIPFSFLIQFFNDILVGGQLFGLTIHPVMHIPAAHSVSMNILYVVINFIGVGFMASGISIYQRVNLLLHPNDDLMQILRFKYFKGSANLGMWFSYTPAIIMGIIAFCMTHSLAYYGIGTLFSLLFQGKMTGISDKLVFPKLTHQQIKVPVKDK